MDNVSSNARGAENRVEPVAAAGANDAPRPEENAVAAPASVSRAPLNLGGAAGAPAAAAAAKAPAPTAAKPATPVARPVPPRPLASPGIAAGARITACKTFFTKLHPGAIHFLDEQIAKWLAENPNIIIKSTNVFQGEITEKKIEPNIVIVVWY
ncbi:MAG: hypothetical protein MUC88_18590 [Planctomycetes bacterium]|jgi:hypothetical protein|nr:hypothetical protein [Planctomycetota bacterium]